MNLNFDTNIISQNEKQKLKKSLNISNDIEFKTVLNKLVQTSFTEYKEMLLGKSIPNRADEIKQLRLFYLIKNYFINRIPTESEVSSMFQLTETQSRSLIRNVLTRFRFQLETEINRTLKVIINNAKLNNDSNYYEVIIQSDNIVDELNNIINRQGPNLVNIKKKSNCARKFIISLDGYELLQNYLNPNTEGCAIL